jgi:vancomycin resistance protein YoaR
LPKNKILTLALIFVLALPAVLMGIKAAELNRWAATGLIHNRVYIHGVAVGGLTAEEATTVLQERYQPSLDEKKIRFTHNKQELAVLGFTEAEARYDFSELTETAHSYGRVRGTRLKSRLSAKPYEINEPPIYIINQNRVMESIKAFCDKTYAAPVNAALSYQNGDISVIRGKEGRTPDTKAAVTQSFHLLMTQTSGEVELNFTSTMPAYAAKDLSFPISRLGRYETQYTDAQGEPRLANIRTASGRIHNTTLYPGEVFSTAAYINSGPSGGYAKAVVLVNGQPTEDFGGGVCQVVTTLYNAVLFAELPVVERHNHSVKVQYADYGFDATVAGDYFDLKFMNDTPHPLLIVSAVQNGRMTVSLYGYDKRPPNRSLAFMAERTEVIPPGPATVKKDASLPPGERWLEAEAQDGYKYDLYKYIYENGALTGKVKVNSSAYKPLPAVVLVNEA